MPIVCIDAGHGAETAGKRSPDGTYLEHEFNLDVARRIRDLLTRRGVKVVMTRDDTRDVSLSERCRISNAAKADAFLSIHTNAAGDGWSTAEGWSAHIIARGGNAEKLAGLIHDIAIPTLGCKDRGISVDNFQVLRDTDAPAVLIEHGFHTSREEVERLKTGWYRERCAQSDAQGILAFFGLNGAEPEDGIAAAATVRQTVYNAAGQAEPGRYIDSGDLCRIGGITPGLLIEVEYPAGAGMRKAYVKSLEGFRAG